MTKREEILRAGFEIVGRDGIEGLHARTIAAEVGVNHAAVHYYFRTRSDLLAALFDYAVERFAADRKTFQSHADGKRTSLELSLIQAAAYGKPASRFWRVWASFYVAAQHEPELLEKMRDHLNSWRDHLATDLKSSGGKKGVKKGLLCDPDILIALLMGQGLVSQVHGDEATAKKHFSTITDAVLGR